MALGNKVFCMYIVPEKVVVCGASAGLLWPLIDTVIQSLSTRTARDPPMHHTILE